MTRSNLTKWILLLALPFAAVTGCVDKTYEESTGQILDSSAITMKVKGRLVADEKINSMSITVKTYKNVVELSGFVDNAEQKQFAADDASKVAGVKAVHNALIVKNQ